MDRLNKTDLCPLDSNYNDIELIETWNEIYNSYGYMMDPFVEKWEREFIPNISENDIETNEDQSSRSEIMMETRKLFPRRNNYISLG